MQRRDYQNDENQSLDECRSDNECMDMDGETTSNAVEYMDAAWSCNPLNELEVLRYKVSELQADLDSAKKSLFCLKNIQENDELIKFYTSFPDYATLFSFCETLLESDVTVMHQWSGKNCKHEYEEGRPCKLLLSWAF